MILRGRLMVGHMPLKHGIGVARPFKKFRDRLTVGRHALDVEIGVRFPVPELCIRFTFSGVKVLKRVMLAQQII